MRAGNKSIELYSAQQAGAPLIILNTFDNEGAEVLEEVRKLTQADFSLVTVSGLSWDDDMTPWPHEGIMKGDTPYGGRADIYIAELEAILSQVGKELGTKPVWTGLAGYSLGGLLPFMRYIGQSCFRVWRARRGPCGILILRSMRYLMSRRQSRSGCIFHWGTRKQRHGIRF